MLKKLPLFFIILLTSHALAITCPSIQDIKNHNLKGWNAYTIDNGTLPSQETMEEFTSHANHFALAEWLNEAPEGSGHCYYEKEIPDYTYLGVFLAQKDLSPDTQSFYWKTKGHDAMHCVVGIAECKFINIGNSGIPQNTAIFHYVDSK